MNWYLAKLVFRILITDSETQPLQFDEQVRLVRGNNPEEALLKARTIGHEEAEEFLNTSKKMIKWEFIDVSQLSEVEELRDGMEVFSRTEEVEEPDGYLHTVKRMAESIVNKIKASTVLSN